MTKRIIKSDPGLLMDLRDIYGVDIFETLISKEYPNVRVASYIDHLVSKIYSKCAADTIWTEKLLKNMMRRNLTDLYTFHNAYVPGVKPVMKLHANQEYLYLAMIRTIMVSIRDSFEELGSRMRERRSTGGQLS